MLYLGRNRLQAISLDETDCKPILCERKQLQQISLDETDSSHIFGRNTRLLAILGKQIIAEPISLDEDNCKQIASLYLWTKQIASLYLWTKQIASLYLWTNQIASQYLWTNQIARKYLWMNQITSQEIHIHELIIYRSAFLPRMNTTKF
ncbi:hypothetical protein HNY73_012956 [Argiope bruennichi]|uniref:Uncharacterized protein n=1 Tax=Argiope bruennichi TaxID=94029 RepID=A0A8T0EYE3_ARGBR|nr:hypothetical protein HNY73_012956 [Argiope bruennichi]